MPTYYIKGETGNDGNAGTSIGTAFKTFAAYQLVAASGDTVIVDESEKVYAAANTGDLLTLTSINNVTVETLNGGKAWVLGYTPIADGSWAAGSGTSDTVTIPTGLTIDGVVSNWINRTVADGRHYGFMAFDNAINTAAGTGTQGRWNYNSITGVLLVNVLGGGAPTNMGYCVAAGRNGFKLTTCSGWTIRNIKFGCFPTSTQGHGIRLQACTAMNIIDCDVYDGGAHSFSDESRAAASTGTVFTRCAAYGGAVGSTLFVTHAEATDIADGLYVACSAVAGRYLGEDQNVLSGLAANAQYIWYTHTSTSGSVLAGGIRLIDCTSSEGEAIVSFVGADNCVSVANGKTLALYPVICLGCSFTIKGRAYFAVGNNSYGFERCTLINTTGAALSFGSGAGIIHMNASGKTLFRYCRFSVDMSHAGDSGTNYGVFCVQGASDQIHFYNCTYYDARTADHLVTIFLHTSSNGVFSSTGGLWVNAKTTSVTNSRLFWNDGSATVATQHDFAGGNVFVNITTDATSQAAADDTRAEFAARVGNVTYTDAAATGTLPNIGTGDISLTGGGLASTTRPSGAVIGEVGINSRPDGGRYGAWQDGSAGEVNAVAGSRLSTPNGRRERFWR